MRLLTAGSLVRVQLGEPNKKTSNRMSFLFAFKLIQINYLVFPQPHSAVNCIVAETLAVRDEVRRGWRSGQNLPALQADSKFWAPQEVGRWFESNLGSQKSRMRKRSGFYFFTIRFSLFTKLSFGIFGK